MVGIRSLASAFHWVPTGRVGSPRLPLKSTNAVSTRRLSELRFHCLCLARTSRSRLHRDRFLTCCVLNFSAFDEESLACLASLTDPRPWLPIGRRKCTSTKMFLRRSPARAGGVALVTLVRRRDMSTRYHVERHYRAYARGRWKAWSRVTQSLTLRTRSTCNCARICCVQELAFRVAHSSRTPRELSVKCADHRSRLCPPTVDSPSGRREPSRFRA